MDAAFWQERWQRGEIGFHKASINPLLQQWWPRLSLSGTESVLVPLCGKSLDLLWLRQAGHPVIGVELARSALEAFDAEHQLALEWTQEGDFAVARGAGFELLCGDYFALQADHLAAVSAVYDRAALIALPLAMRGAKKDQRDHLMECLPQRSRQMLMDEMAATGPVRGREMW